MSFTVVKLTLKHKIKDLALTQDFTVMMTVLSWVETVMGEQDEKFWAETAAVWCSCAYLEFRGDPASHPQNLRSVREVVHDQSAFLV